MPWSQPASANPRQLVVQLLGGLPGKITRVHLPTSAISSSFLFSRPGKGTRVGPTRVRVDMPLVNRS
ncbi:hypothetical protein F2Q70_00016864 [Brassica cretica]|uniref:Uncharacterized protein n=1 Tax=Brassica cretica TaxID=69181 RepID=A0A8S9I563_BRACR|nr:hypothetical protein F2Q70_00016864 [Brassica cretica]